MPQTFDGEFRKQWRCNRCQVGVYGFMRFYHWSFWVYLAPFLALTLSAIVPYMAEEFASAEATEDGDALNDDYLDWIQQTRDATGAGEDGYEEISIEEQIAMMEAIPVQGEGWTVDPQILVAPLSLD